MANYQGTVSLHQRALQGRRALVAMAISRSEALGRVGPIDPHYCASYLPSNQLITRLSKSQAHHGQSLTVSDHVRLSVKRAPELGAKSIRVCDEFGARIFIPV